MKEDLIAAIAAIPVPPGTGSGRWPVNPRKTSLENKDSIVITYSHFTSPSQFWTTDDKYSYKKKGLYTPQKYARNAEEMKILIGQDIPREKAADPAKKEIAALQQIDRRPGLRSKVR